MLFRFAIRRLLAGILVLLAITYVAFLTQDISARKRSMQPSPLGVVASEAWAQTADLWGGLLHGDLGQYGMDPRWQHPTNLRPMSQLLTSALSRSGVLLLLAMGLGGFVGALLGIGAVAFRRRSASLGMLLLSILGVSTPSFVLVVLLQFGVILFYRSTGTRLLPAGGFGYDAHMVLPVLVLAARPIAQVARLTSAHMETLINEDFVRVARSKGLTEREIWFGHILPNVTGTVLAAVASSLRFSLSSLPLVETFFGWRGLGYHLLERIESYDTRTAVVLVVLTGLIFVILNALVDFGIRVLDPRLRRAEAVRSAQMESGNWLELAWWSFLRAVTLSGLRERRKRQHLPPLPVERSAVRESPEEMSRVARSMRWGRLRAWRKATAGNPALVLGAILGVALLLAVVAGPRLSPHNPYTTLTRVEVDGELVTPPVPPSAIYPLGTDTLGRDILSLLLHGASRTLMLAVIAVAARLVIGGLFGFLAGWFHDSLLDRLLMALGELVNSFPALLLATLVVYAVGVRQGLYAFVVGLLVIGWPEVMQAVRARVVSVRPLAYIEGAVAAGAGQGEILTRHVLPNIWPTMVSLAFLEMGGALMILGELGFLGVFIGGGWAAEGEERPLLYYYDVPEWGVMMANSWQSFRSYPWTMIYPALAFMVAIVAFTLLGEGLRRLADELTLSMKALFNRHTFVAVAVTGLIVWWGFQSTGIWAANKPLAKAFSGERAVADAAMLASPDFAGRQLGTSGGEAAAAWIADEFKKLGMIPVGDEWTFFQNVRASIPVMEEPSQLLAWDASDIAIPLMWGSDYADSPEVGNREASVARGEIIYAATVGGRELDVGEMRRALGLSDQEAVKADRILLVDQNDVWLTVPLYALYTDPEPVPAVGASAMLVVVDDPDSLLRRQLPGISLQTTQLGIHRFAPMIYVTEETADRLLAGSGYTLAELRARRQALSTGQGLWVPTGARAEARLSGVRNEEFAYRNVLAMWPGEDTDLDNEMIIISAYYDGLGTWGGVMYPGANDNASGVAVMLEMIRSWKEWGFKPKRTTLFVAWAGGERYAKPDVRKWLSVRPGFEDFRVLGVFEMEGVGAGQGDAPLLWRSSSERVSGMVHTAARRLGLSLTDAGSGLHADELPRSEIDLDYPRVYLGWPGAGSNTHLPADTPDTLDSDKIERAGRILSLTTAVMLTDPAY